MNQRLTRPAALACLIILAQPAILLSSWGVIPLALVIVATFLIYQPNHLLHPNVAIFTFYFLWLVLPSFLSLVLYLIDWTYILPWGQLTFWDDLSAYTLLQIELTFLTLYLGCHFLGNPSPPTIQNFMDTPDGVLSISRTTAIALSGATLLLVLVFIRLTGGWHAWLSSYSDTYLLGRQGLGAFNFVLIAIGNLTVFLLGLRNFARRGGLLGMIPALIVILPLGYVGGFKSRVMFLLFLFMFPYLIRMVPRLSLLAAGFLSFLVMLYLLTLVRTSGFYASPPAFLEMMAGYFNSYPLHDQIVTSREPDFFQTVFQVLVKPLQYLGLMRPDADFDISVMLTKEFFPAQWDLGRGTQQWPIETDLYLNYFGIPFQWIPLLCYAGFLSWIFRSAITRQNYALMPIYALEFLRVFSVMRGGLISWHTPVLLLQYGFLYYATRSLVRPHPVQTIDARTRARDNTDLVYFALCNERQIDIHFSTKVLKQPGKGGLPYFKVMKLRIWHSRLGLLFWPIITLAACLIPLLAVIQWGQALLSSFGARPVRMAIQSVEASAANKALIARAVAHMQSGQPTPVQFSAQNPRFLAAALGPVGIFRCIWAHIRLLDRILLTGPTRTDLLLHARDAFAMLMLAEYARVNPDAIFITESHYQRWAFILSHRAKRLWIVQHGYLYDDIDFPYPYGRVTCLICRDPLFGPKFETYYAVDTMTTLPSGLVLNTGDTGDSAVFLASSSVSIDAELALIAALKQRSKAPVIVKLHPHHNYDNRVNKLTSLADKVVTAEEFPDCRVLVTFNSFIEFEYRALGKKTVSIDRAGSVEHALHEVLDALHGQ